LKLHEGYVKTLVALLIQVSCCCDLLTLFNASAIYSNSLV